MAVHWGCDSGPDADHLRRRLVAVFPNDFRSVRSFAERSNNIVHWMEMPRGGHFASSDTPDLLVADIRQFFRTVIG